MVPLLFAALAQTTNQVETLERVNKAELSIFNLKDDGGRTMDCLKVEEVEPGRFIGIYHSLIDGVFELQVAESKDLRTWVRKGSVDRRAHQGTIRKWSKGWLLAWEKDGRDGNWIRVASFSSLENLYAGKADKVKDLPRKLSQFAEGTPSIFLAFESEIRIDFHYYRGGDVDRQASGILRDFETWEAAPVDSLNQTLEETYKGNVGDRDDVRTPNTQFKLIECQKVKNDWSSWRVIAHNYRFFRELKIATPGRSKSFANPSATLLSDGRTVVTMYLHSAGAAKNESGCLLYVVRFPGR